MASLERAFELAEQGALDAACEEFDRALPDAPDSADAWNVFAHALAAMGRAERADTAFGVALDLNPHLLTASYGRALQRMRLQDLPAAEALLRSVVRYRPHITTSYHDLGRVLAQQQRFEEALAAYEEWQQLSNPHGTLGPEQEAARERGVPAIVLVGMQKSATEYILSVLLDATQAPAIYPDLGTTPRNFLIPSLTRQLAGGGCVTRVHLDASPHNLAVLREAGIRRIALQLRDPRGATLSFAHHIARIDADEFRRFSAYHSPALPADYRAWTLADRLAWCVEHYFPGALGFTTSWLQVLQQEHPDLELHMSVYEEFTRDPARYFEELFAFFGLPCSALSEVLGRRQPGAGRNFRSGDPNEWRTAFSPEQRTAMREQMPDALLAHFGWS